MFKPIDSHITIHIESDAIINSIGFTTMEVLDSMRSSKSGSRSIPGYTLSEPTAMLSFIDKERFNSTILDSNRIQNPDYYTFFEKIQIFVIQEALKKCSIDPSDSKVLFLFSSTKGNVDFLSHNNQSQQYPQKLFLWKSSELIKNYFGNPNTEITISNACISGTQAIIRGAEILARSQYDHVIVVGADCISPFIVAGFQSFKALSDEICRPFDLNRKGLNIGEGAAAVILSKNLTTKPQILGGCITNDANHISGPSRTGEGLYRALTKCIEQINMEDISFINAHGTATPYNDDMESIAFERIGLQHTPVNSYKAYFGHTLGAAGIIESIISAHALQNGEIFDSKGYDINGVSSELNIQKKHALSSKNICLKTASGFGGCNGVLAMKRGGDHGK
jgi:3-oxoacyl-[acyl-carrier-protein] synthase I